MQMNSTGSQMDSPALARLNQWRQIPPTGTQHSAVPKFRQFLQALLEVDKRDAAQACSAIGNQVGQVG